MRKLFTTRRRIVAAGAGVAIALAGGGLAFAYFTSTGSGTGQAQVGTAGSWSVAQTGVTGSMYPGVGESDISFTVTNNGSGNQAVTAANATLGTDGSGNITQNGGSAVSGCLATWFTTPAVTTTLPTASVAPSGTTTITVKLTMNDAATNQDACVSVHPDVTLNITG